MKIEYVCTGCGSENVKADAWATWNAESQSWELETGPGDKNAWCYACDGYTSLDQKELCA